MVTRDTGRGMRTQPRRAAGSPPPLARLTYEALLDMLIEAQAIDETTRRDLLSKKETFRARFLRDRFGAAGLKKKDYTVSPTELVDTAQVCRIPRRRAGRSTRISSRSCSRRRPTAPTRRSTRSSSTWP